MRRMSDERGATIVIVAISMVLLVGMAAFVIDVSAMYQERRELQNGADAAALAIAEDCVRGETCTTASATDTAGVYADANAADEASDATIAELDASGGRVTVDTTTRTAGGATALSFLFEPALDLIGGDDADSKTVTASATAVWGAPSSMRTLPLTISMCEWTRETLGGTYYPTAPYDIDGEVLLRFHQPTDPAAEPPGNGGGGGGGPGGGGGGGGGPGGGGGAGGADGCAAGPAGMDADRDGKLPAGFGWVESADDCEVVTTAHDESDWALRDPGVNTECTAEQLDKVLGTVVGVPVFDDFCRTNDATCPAPRGDKYEVARFAAFYVTGYDLGGPQYEGFDSAYRSAAPDCTTNRESDACITGFFTTFVDSGGSLGGPKGGVFIIRLID
jgi:Flp pilus assembly protein TadG